ncbi:MAG: hypothetical protein Q7S32_04195 [bacterium]|nr:hypothetical protein [bacterium]
MGEIPPCSSKKLLKAFAGIGLEIKENCGKGSHAKVIDPKTGHSTTVPYSKDLSYVREKIVKTVVNWGYKKKDIIEKI